MNAKSTVGGSQNIHGVAGAPMSFNKAVPTDNNYSQQAAPTMSTAEQNRRKCPKLYDSLLAKKTGWME